MTNDKGEIKKGIFFFSIMSSIVFCLFMIVAISDMYVTRTENEYLKERIREQKQLIEFLKDSDIK